MLASTVQFSNNDQPPTTPETTSRVHWGRQLKADLAAVPSDTQQRARHPRPSWSAFHTPKSSTSSPSRLKMPSSQRSTHEQPAPDVRR
jgi:hypothetical protein